MYYVWRYYVKIFQDISPYNETKKNKATSLLQPVALILNILLNHFSYG